MKLAKDLKPEKFGPKRDYRNRRDAYLLRPEVLAPRKRSSLGASADWFHFVGALDCGKCLRHVARDG